jgi:hypothetical protein
MMKWIRAGPYPSVSCLRGPVSVLRPWLDLRVKSVKMDAEVTTA